MTNYLNCGRNLTVDNFFTSVDLALWLLARKTTIIGTIRKNKRDVPKAFTAKEVLDEINHPVYSFLKLINIFFYFTRYFLIPINFF